MRVVLEYFIRYAYNENEQKRKAHAARHWMAHVENR